MTFHPKPDMTGVELAEEILTIRANMPIIMRTGFSQLVDANKAAVSKPSRRNFPQEGRLRRRSERYWTGSLRLRLLHGKCAHA